VKNVIYLLLLLLFVTSCSSIPVSFREINKEELSTRIETIFNDTLFSHAHWGVLIQSLKNGRTIYERNADRMFMPASNEKIPTSAATLIKLGSDFTFQTIIGNSGYRSDSTIYGDLIIIGDGDPTLSDRIYEKPTTVFELWADSILSFGVNVIDGNIIGDDNKYDDSHLGYGWTFMGLDYWPSAEISALQLNENYIDLQFIPPLTKIDTLQIVPDLESEYYKIIDETEIVDTGKTDLNISSNFGQNNIVIKGKVLQGSKKFERSPTITNPTKFYATVLKEVLERKGIKILGHPKDCDDIDNYSDSIRIRDTLLVHHSPPMKEMLKVLMKRSQNLYAETMIRILGYKKSGIGSFKEGKKVVEEVLLQFGIEKDTYAFMDGSGLSRYNFISPNQVVKILKGMRNSPYWDVWYDIQPIAGIDGTLRKRMKGTKAEGNVRAKTGTISNVRGLSGYVSTSEGEEIVFSFLVNGHLQATRETELITDKVLELIAEYPVIKNEKAIKN